MTAAGWRLACLLLWPCIAFAHTPYLSAPFSCDMDGGQQMRFLNGDGLFGPDPKAAVILGPDGGIRGYLPVGLTSFPMLGSPCSVYDSAAKAVFVRDADTAISGPVLDGTDKAARAARWQWDPTFPDKTPAPVGFKRSDPQPSAMAVLAAEAVYRTHLVAFLIAVSSVICGCLVAVARLPWRSKRLASVAAAVGLFGVGGFLAFLAFVFAALQSLSAPLYLLCLVCGGGVAAGVWALIRFAGWRREKVGAL